MGRFNLVDEAWIEVMIDKSGEKRLVSLRDIFENSQNYLDIAGDMHIQDFAIMRVILSIMHTVFSRHDAYGNPYEEIELDENMQQIYPVDEEDYEDYEDDLMSTWEDLWKAGRFPKVVIDYLDKWNDRFYLYDEKYPFFQVTKDNMSIDKIKGKSIGQISGKTFNRTITESNNKQALFSPKSEASKNILRDDEIARWLICFQGYTGLSDKTIYGNENYKTRNSKGWLYDLGAIYFKGANLFKTLMLNFVIFTNQSYSYNIQKPAWEFTDSELLHSYLNYLPIDNISELYTTYSRALYIDPTYKAGEDFNMNLIKLPEVDHLDNFLEPMTIYGTNKTGPNKGRFTPKKHPANQSMWRSFGQITLGKVSSYGSSSEDKVPKPGIISWLKVIEGKINDRNISVNALSLEDDGNATSWVPVNEIYDYMPMYIQLLVGENKEDWTRHIYEMVEKTKNVISNIYGGFLRDIVKIRGLDKSGYVNNEIEKMYYLVDKPFRDLIESIGKDTDRKKILIEWDKTLKNLVYKEAYKKLETATAIDYRFRDSTKVETNIITSFNKFTSILNKVIERKESEQGD